MKKIILLALVLMASATHAKTGSEGVGGGAGVKKNGVYKTFYSAGLYVEPTYIDTEEIPGLNETIDQVSNMSFLGAATKAMLINALLPSPDRQYFIAKPEGLTEEIQNKLLAEFSKATGQDPEQINLFGLTDKKQKVTYLLPGFFQLGSLQERQAALFHEALWIARPNFKYNEIIQAEMAFQAILDNPNNYAAIADFSTRVSINAEDAVIAALYQDKKTNALKGFLDENGSVSFGTLLGKEYFNCVAEENLSLRDLSAGLFSKNAEDNCSALAKLNIFKLSNVYKKSIVLKTLLKSFGQDTLPGYTTSELFFTIRSESVTSMEQVIDDYLEIEVWTKLEVIEFLQKNEYRGLAYLGGSFVQKCTIDFSMLTVKQNNIRCPNLGKMKNNTGNFSFGIGIAPKR